MQSPMMPPTAAGNAQIGSNEYQHEFRKLGATLLTDEVDHTVKLVSDVLQKTPYRRPISK